MKRGGQITIFVLAAIIIIVAIVTIIYFTNKNQTETQDDEYFSQQSVRTKIDNIRDYTIDCIEAVSKESLIIVAAQGGYYTKDSNVYNYNPTFFPYYYEEGKINIPTLDNIQTELGRSVSDKIVECLDNNKFIEFTLKYENPITNVIITKQNAFIEIDMPVEIKQEGHKTIIELEGLPLNINSSLYEIYEVAEYITNSHKEDSEYFCISCLAKMAEERNLYIYQFSQTENEKITGIIIYENTTGIADPYSFIFFNKYSGDEKTSKLNI